jgi:hypothetical protein
MHPLIAAALSTQLTQPAARPHRRAASRGTPERGGRRVAASGPRRVAAAESAVMADGSGDIVIRVATPADAAALVRLGALDGNRSAGELLAAAAADHAVLVAEVDGSVEAALALEGGLAVADPFRPSALDLQLLAMRARQLGGDAPRARGHRLGVLRPRTS